MYLQKTILPGNMFIGINDLKILQFALEYINKIQHDYCSNITPICIYNFTKVKIDNICRIFLQYWQIKSTKDKQNLAALLIKRFCNIALEYIELN